MRSTKKCGLTLRMFFCINGCHTLYTTHFPLILSTSLRTINPINELLSIIWNACNRNYKMLETTTMTPRPRAPSSTKKKRHYVNNKDFLDALVAYKALVQEALDDNRALPPIPKYIGECIYNIANRLSHKPCFASYSFRSEMIGDGIENCFVYLTNFDHNKTSNPFAYFTQIIKFAFIRRIQKEKKQLYIRHKISELQLYSNMRTEKDGDGDVMEEFIQNYEDMLETKREKARNRPSKKAVD